MLTFMEKRTFWHLVIAGILTLTFVGCSAPKNWEHTNTALPTQLPLKATKELRSISTVSLVQPPFSACDNSKFALPESVMAAGEKIDSEEYWDRYRKYPAKQDEWLSIRLDPARAIIPYADPIPFRLTVTNETDHPIIFVRPLHISFSGDLVSALPIVQLRVRMTSSGHEVKPSKVSSPLVHFRPAPREAFSMLPSRESCTMDLQLTWNKTFLPLEAPIPPGDYQMNVVLKGTDLGPGTSEYRDFDIGGWVGST